MTAAIGPSLPKWVWQLSDILRTCVDAPVNASKIFPSVSMWSGADVCPASMCGFLRAAGLYGDARIGSNTLTLQQLQEEVPHS
jgi:hypothetical protein